ncbi:MAG: hypothetical protein WCI22_15290 [Actinomycetota bacterium]
MVGSAASGPFIDWPGDDAPSLYVVDELIKGDSTIDPFYSATAAVVTYADGSQERLPGDGSILVLLPGVKCGYVFTTPIVHVDWDNFFHSLRIVQTANP